MSLLLNDNFTRPNYAEPYKPGPVSIEFFSWINVHLEKEKHKTPKMHYQMIDELLGEDQNVQAMVHRGGAKSTVFSNQLPIYVAAKGELPNFGVVNNLCIFSATIEQAIEQLKGIRDLWDSSEILQELLTLGLDRRGKVVADKVDYICWENPQGNRIHIQAKGAGQSMRGTKKEKVRPQLLIFDDILIDAILTSETERKKLKTWFYSTVANSVDIDHYKKIIIGTPMTDDDLLMNMLRSPEYKSIKLPVADKFPVAENEIVSSWKDRFTPKRITALFREAKSVGAEADFYREMMLEVVNDDMRVFEADTWMDYQYSLLKPKLKGMNIYTSMDLAVSVKKSADLRCIITIAVNEQGHWFILQIDKGYYNPTEMIDKLFEHIRRYNPLETRAEKAALQQVLDHFIQERMMETQTFFNYQGLENNSSQSKEFRILALQPMTRMKKIHYPIDRSFDGVAELKYEMLGYINTGKTTQYDDVIDCLANFLDPDFVTKPSTDQGSEIEDEVYDPLDMLDRALEEEDEYSPY